MSHPIVLAEVTDKLRDLLLKPLQDLLGNAISVVREDPAQPAVGGANSTRLSLWLYQVVPDEFGRNLPATTGKSSNGKIRPTPLPVTLSYLVTPLFGNAETDQRALGVVMATLHQTPIISLHMPPPQSVDEELRISIVSDQLDDRMRLWDSLNQPYRLSICYVVRTVRLDIDEQIAGKRVEEVNADMADHATAEGI